MNNRLAWRIAVRESSLDATAKHVALTLDTFMDKRGLAWPGRQTLAEATGYAVRTVDRALVRLEQAGLLTVKRGGGRRSNRYCAVHNRPVDNSLAATLTTRAATLTTSSSLVSDTRSRKELVIEQPDPVSLELAHQWLAAHRMPV